MTATAILSHFINGERVPAAAEHASENPSDTRDIVARFPDGSSSEVDAAVAAARKAAQGAGLASALLIALSR